MDIGIRRMSTSDLDDLFELLSDPIVMKYLEPPFTRDKTEQFLQLAGLTEDPLILAIDFQGEFAGYVIYHDYDDDSIEIGWVIKPNLWGKGLASKLTDLLIEISKPTGKDLIIECSPDQEATKHIAKKYGFVFEGTQSGLELFRLKR